MRAGVLDWQAVLGTGDHSGGAEEKEVIITACTEVIEMSKYTVHQIKIDFHVTEQICRFVYVYIIEGESLYLIDSGVFGCEKQIIAYLNTIGRSVSEIRGIFLTHAHPDHIGSAAWFQEHTGAKIYTSEGEKRWIEDIDLEFRERPIPNFYRLAGRKGHGDRGPPDSRSFLRRHFLSPGRLPFHR